MNSALNLIMMTRDKDLRRWGRLSAVIMIFLGCFLLCAVFYSYHVVHSRIEPAMLSSLESEHKLIESIVDEKVQTALVAGLESKRQGINHLLDGARVAILGGGIGFAIISFYAALLSWRAYELAGAGSETSKQNKSA